MHRYLLPSLFIHLMFLMLLLVRFLPTDKLVEPPPRTSPIQVNIIPASEFRQPKQTETVSIPETKPVSKQTETAVGKPHPKTSASLPEEKARPAKSRVAPEVSIPAKSAPMIPPIPPPSEPGMNDTGAKESLSENIPTPGRSPGAFKSGESVVLYDPSIVNWPSVSKKQTLPEITLDTAEFKQLGYLYKLKDRIEHAWNYPSSAMRLGMTGDLYIRFVIQEDGSLKEVRLLRTSGNPTLDEAALQAIKEAAPFLPLPKQWKTDQFAIKGHFVYTLNGYQMK